jgi:hypothetical protein
MQGGPAKAKQNMQDGRQNNARWSSKKLQDGRAEVKNKCKMIEQNNARWPIKSFFFLNAIPVKSCCLLACLLAV